MDSAALYDEDFYAWSLHQAMLLRSLAGANVHLPNDLDLEHVAEEIEDLGNEQRFAVESNLMQAFAHLIKIVALPDDPAMRHWLKETDAFLIAAGRRYRPSMRRAIDLADIWRDGRRLATRALEIDENPVPPLPEQPPFGLDELVNRQADVRALAARLAVATRPVPKT
jgi:hypothetical protein